MQKVLFWGVDSLRWDVVLNLSAGGRGMFLPQLNVPSFVPLHGRQLPLGGVDEKWVTSKARGT